MVLNFENHLHNRAFDKITENSALNFSAKKERKIIHLPCKTIAVCKWKENVKGY
jgi:hypothetical protein